MSDLVFASGLVVIATPYLIYTWVRAERQARKEIVKLTPPRDVTLDEHQTEWLVAQFIRRAHWTAVATAALDAVFIGVLVLLHDVRLVAEAGGVLFGIVIALGYLVGSILATTVGARSAAGARRSASLTIRSAATYLHGWERWVRIGHLAAAGVGVATATALSLRGPLAAGPGRFYVGLAVGWLVLATGLILLERWVLRTPQVVDESLHLTRELLISLAVRTAALFHLPLLAVLGYVGATYASLTFGLSWGWTMVPLYAVGAVGLAEHVSRDSREEEGVPAPEWFFARTLESTA